MRSPGPSVSSAPNSGVAVAVCGSPIHEYAPGEGRQAQAGNLELAAFDCQRRGGAAKRDLAPAPARRPEIDRVSRASRGEADFADALVEGESNKGIQERIARKRARVVAAALDVVEGIAARAARTMVNPSSTRPRVMRCDANIYSRPVQTSSE